MEFNKNQKNAVGAKPTLLSRPQIGIPANNDTKNHATDERILSSLQAEPLAGRQAKKTASGTNTKLLSLLGISVVTAAAGFSGYQYLSGPAAPAEKAVVATRDVRATTQAPVVTAPLPALDATPASVPETAAIFVDPSVGPTPVPGEAKLTTALEKDVKPAPATIKKALETKEPEKTAIHIKKVKVQDTNAATTVASKKEKSVEKKANEPAPVATAHPVPVKGHPATAVDEDVNLLAALIAHSDASAVPDRTGARRAAAAKASAASDLEKEKKEKKAKKAKAAKEAREAQEAKEEKEAEVAKKLKKEKKAAKEKAAAEKKKKLLAESADN